MVLIKPRSFKLEKFKKGDIIISAGKVGIFSSLGHHPDGGSHNDESYFFVYVWCWLFDPIDDFVYDDGYIININARKARKTERDYLFSKLIENGYKKYNIAMLKNV